MNNITKSNWFWVCVGLVIGNIGNQMFPPVHFFGYAIDWSIIAILFFVLGWNLTRWLTVKIKKRVIEWLRKNRHEIFKDA